MCADADSHGQGEAFTRLGPVAGGALGKPAFRHEPDAQAKGNGVPSLARQACRGGRTPDVLGEAARRRDLVAMARPERAGKPRRTSGKMQGTWCEPAETCNENTTVGHRMYIHCSSLRGSCRHEQLPKTLRTRRLRLLEQYSASERLRTRTISFACASFFT